MTARKPARGQPAAAKRPRRSTVREPLPEYTGLPAAWPATSSPQRETPLVMDTHVWLWTLDGTPGSLGLAARTLIDRAATAGIPVCDARA